jgi:hypothetical protein
MSVTSARARRAAIAVLAAVVALAAVAEAGPRKRKRKKRGKKARPVPVQPAPAPAEPAPTPDPAEPPATAEPVPVPVPPAQPASGATAPEHATLDDPFPPAPPPPAATPTIPALEAGTPGIDRRGGGGATPDDLDVRLTLSSFLYRESGASGPPLVDMGAPVEGASPVRRYFGDLRAELADDGFTFDGRMRQTTSQRYQSGAGAGGEYDLRTLSYRIGSGTSSIVLGRQLIEPVGATRIDGASGTLRLSDAFSATAFAGALPQIGSRSVDTDYPTIVNPDGTTGSRLVPIGGGAGVTYTRPNLHGDLGVGAAYVPQQVVAATSTEKSRVFVATSGYGRPARWLDVYHLGLVDVAGAAGTSVTNASLGVNAHPTASLQLSASINHVGTDVLQIAARNVLVDPDPTAIGIVQNDIAVVRVAQDVARVGASLALARSRFEVSVSGSVHRRPAVSVDLADGGTFAFPEARSGSVGIVVLDRKSIAGLRVSASATITFPLGTDVPNRARGGVVRLTGSRAFAGGRGEIEADVAVRRSRDVGGGSSCGEITDVLSCYGASTTTSAQAGALATWRIGREWLVLVDAHAGALTGESSAMTGTVAWPTVLSLTAFARVQWRYH